MTCNGYFYFAYVVRIDERNDILSHVRIFDEYSNTFRIFIYIFPGVKYSTNAIISTYRNNSIQNTCSKCIEIINTGKKITSLIVNADDRRKLVCVCVYGKDRNEIEGVYCNYIRIIVK